MQSALHRCGGAAAARPRSLIIPRARCSASTGRSDVEAAASASRRAILAAALAAPLLTTCGRAGATGGRETLKSDTLAYEFTYPTQTASGREIPLTFSRKPERYSSAAPLTADARQRIVAELVSLGEGITYAMLVGPLAGPLRERPLQDITPRQIALTVLTDRSTARNTSGQRIPLASLEAAAAEDRDGTTYYVYESLQQGSPNVYDQALATYRHSISVTAVRVAEDGTPYLYTLALACPESKWSDLEAGFREAAASFRLTTPTRDYVSPEREPWMFF